MKRLLLPALLALAPGLVAQDPEPGERFEQARGGIQQQLEQSLQELSDLREQIKAETLPMNRRLSELESRLSEVRAEYQAATRTLDSRTLDLSNLVTEIKSRKDEVAYLSNLLSDYLRNFRSRLHIAEEQRYRAELEAAALALENPELTDEQVFAVQAKVLDLAIRRLHEAVGGTRFEGTALSDGLVERGQFVLFGPAAVFRSDDGGAVGVAEMQTSTEPTVGSFGDPLDAEAAGSLVATGAGSFPLDATLGDARKIEATQETLAEHIQKGGPVMIPIFAMAGVALLIALLKWLGLTALPVPSRKRLEALYGAVESGDEEQMQGALARVRGPYGRMLQSGVEHLSEPRELIEEAMYESVLSWRMKVQRWLPFIAICAASAPLLGLLGTVTGIINTFKMITLFGSGDVKSLSGGISEALITTKFGLIVAIPSLLLHSFLARKAKRFIDGMEAAAVAFVNRASRGRAAAPAALPAGDAPAAGDEKQIRAQVSAILNDLLGPLVREDLEEELSPAAER